MTVEELAVQAGATEIIINFLEEPDFPIQRTGNLSKDYRLYI
tara:strand:- start:1387 stop:1512 length:126 start_codon:yes stop_codon:yes gene_type:complete